MARATVMRDLQTAVGLGVPAAPLVFPIFEGVAARLAGETYHDFSTKAVAMTKVWDQSIERFDVDWAGLFVDDLFEYEPLGIEITDGPDHPYAVTQYLPADQSTLAHLRVPNFRKDARLPALLEAQRRIRERWGNQIVISKSVAAPFSGLTLLCGIPEVMLLVYDDPELLRRLMGFVEELAIAFSLALLAAGADVIWLGDCSASSRFLSLSAYRELALAPAQRVAAAINRAGGLVIYHAGENKLPFLEEMAGVAPDVLSVEAGIDLAAVKRTVGSRVCLSGNLDGVHLLWHGQPPAIEAATRHLVTEVASQGGVIVNTGEGIPEQTPATNLTAMFRTIRAAWPHGTDADHRGARRPAN